jgi:hypothetical protein
MSRSTHRRYAVITADVIGSRQIRSFTQKRDRILKEISRLHFDQKLILSSYTVTAWDEFEVVLAKPQLVPRAVLDLRRIFYPLQLRIAIGVGPASGVYKKPINQKAGGAAFERARKAAEESKTGNSKYPLLTVFNSGNDLLDTIANTIYRLQDSLLQRTTAKQWAAINAHLTTGSQDQTARRLNLDISTISRNLKRGSYWQLVETAEALERILSAFF